MLPGEFWKSCSKNLSNVLFGKLKMQYLFCNTCQKQSGVPNGKDAHLRWRKTRDTGGETREPGGKTIFLCGIHRQQQKTWRAGISAGSLLEEFQSGSDSDIDTQAYIVILPFLICNLRRHFQKTQRRWRQKMRSLLSATNLLILVLFAYTLLQLSKVKFMTFLLRYITNLLPFTIVRIGSLANDRKPDRVRTRSAKMKRINMDINSIYFQLTFFRNMYSFLRMQLLQLLHRFVSSNAFLSVIFPRPFCVLSISMNLRTTLKLPPLV